MDQSILRCHQSGPVSLPVHVFLRQSRLWSHEDPGEAAGPGQKSWLIVELNTSKHIKTYRKYFLSLLTHTVPCILQLKAGYFLHSNSRSSKTRSKTHYFCGSLQNEVPNIEQLNLDPRPAWLKVSGKLTSRFNCHSRRGWHSQESPDKFCANPTKTNALKTENAIRLDLVLKRDQTQSQPAWKLGFM